MMGGRKRWEKIRYGGILVEGTPLTVMMVIMLEAFMKMMMAMLNYEGFPNDDHDIYVIMIIRL